MGSSRKFNDHRGVIFIVPVILNTAGVVGGRAVKFRWLCCIAKKWNMYRIVLVIMNAVVVGLVVVVMLLLCDILIVGWRIVVGAEERWWFINRL